MVALHEEHLDEIRAHLPELRGVVLDDHALGDRLVHADWGGR